MLFKFNIKWSVILYGLLGILTFCGFHPIGRKSIALKNLILVASPLAHLAFATTLAVYGCHSFSTNDSDINSFNNILKFSSVVSTYFIMCLESLIVRKNFHEIWNRINETDDLIRSMLMDYNSVLNNFFEKFSKRIILPMMLSLFIELVVILNIFDISKWRFMWSISIVPILMSRFGHFHHMVFIEILSCRLRVIKEELKIMVKLTKIESNRLVKRNTIFYDGLFKKLNTTKSTYNTLWETSIFINRSFGVSQLLNFLQNFIQLTCDLYLLYTFLYKNDLTYITGELKISSLI